MLIRRQKVTLDTDLVSNQGTESSSEAQQGEVWGEFVFQLTNFRGFCIRFSEHGSLLF